MLILNLAEQRIPTQPVPTRGGGRWGGQTCQKWGGRRQRALTDVRVQSLRAQR